MEWTLDKTWLAVDPGHSTGVAFASEGQLQWTGTFQPDAVLPTIAMIDPDILVVETVPQNNPDPLTASLLQTIKNHWGDRPGLWLVSPGHWKPFARKQNWQMPSGKDRHQKDAAMMLRWAILQKTWVDIEKDIERDAK